MVHSRVHPTTHLFIPHPHELLRCAHAAYLLIVSRMMINQFNIHERAILLYTLANSDEPRPLQVLPVNMLAYSNVEKLAESSGDKAVNNY